MSLYFSWKKNCFLKFFFRHPAVAKLSKINKNSSVGFWYCYLFTIKCNTGIPRIISFSNFDVDLIIWNHAENNWKKFVVLIEAIFNYKKCSIFIWATCVLHLLSLSSMFLDKVSNEHLLIRIFELSHHLR